MPTLHFNLDNEVNVQNINGQINADTETLISTDYDLAFFGVGNFFQGNYTQHTDSPNDIRSNLSIIQGGINRMRMFLADDDAAAGSRTTYGNSVNGTVGGLYYGHSTVTDLQQENTADANVALADVTTYTSKDLYPLVDLADASSAVSNDVLIKDKSSVGHGLLQLVSAAIFKKLGKNAALLNDTNLVSDINSNFKSGVETSLSETNSTYADSKFFKRYLESGRYASDSADINSIVDYSMNDTVVNMIVNLSGHVSDADGSVEMNATTIAQIFGSDHKIANDGSYEIKAFVSLRHDERF